MIEIVRQCITSEFESNEYESNYSDDGDISLSSNSVLLNESCSDVVTNKTRSDGSETETASTTSSSLSLLDVLKAPIASDLSRKR